MALVRHGAGPRAVLRAYASQIHPVFMLPPIAAGLFGALLAARSSPFAFRGFAAPSPLASVVSPSIAAVHAAALFFAVYTAHVKDGYVDFHVRGEDDDHPLTARGCRLGLVGASVAFGLCLLGLWTLAGPGAVALTLPTWLIAYHHAPQLDVHPVTATCGYPAGVALAILGGHYAQAGALAPAPTALAGLFFVLLTGVKIVDDTTDYEYDRSIRKRTAAVVLGPHRARTLAHALFAVALFAVAALALTPILPGGAALAVLAFAPVAAVSTRADPELATKLLIRGSYVFLAVLVAAVWFQPLS